MTTFDNIIMIEYQIWLSKSNMIEGRMQLASSHTVRSITNKIEKLEAIRDLSVVEVADRMKWTQDDEVKEGDKLILQKKGSSLSMEDSLIETFIHQEQAFHEPRLPPKVRGEVSRPYKLISCLSSTRVLQLTSHALTLSKTEETPPQLTILVRSITSISWFRKSSVYFIRVKTKDAQFDFRFRNKQICAQWIWYFQQTINFHEELEERRKYWSEKKVEKMLKELGEEKVVIVGKELSQPILPDGSCIIVHQRTLNIADFKIKGKIGEGAFSSVYKASRNKKVYALKRINKTKLFLNHQVKYAIAQLQILKKCKQCPFIVPLYFAFQTYDSLYLALKFSACGTLGTYVKKRNTLPIDEAFQILCQLIVAMEYLHKRRILYRDLKPENILIHSDGHILLTDFGLSIELSEGEEFAESFVGTPLFMVPERMEGTGKVNYKADIYGVGSIFYFMLHGKSPYESDSFSSIVFKMKHTPVSFRNDLDPFVRKFLQQCLEINPEKRISQLSSHPIFHQVNWNSIISKSNTHLQLSHHHSSVDQIEVKIDQDYKEQNYPSNIISHWQYP